MDSKDKLLIERAEHEIVFSELLNTLSGDDKIKKMFLILREMRLFTAQ